MTVPFHAASLFRSGLLLPESVPTTPWFTALASFVALNTVIYVSLALLKIFPAPRVSRLMRRGRQRRSETRSIYPDSSS